MPEHQMPTIDIPSGNSRLNAIYRLIRQLPVGWKMRSQMKKIFSAFMKLYNVRFHNLPSAFPDDFTFERAGRYTYRLKQRSLTISVKASSVTRSEEMFESEVIDNKREYVLKKCDRHEFTLSIGDKRKLYSLVRDMGFIHFDHEDITVSFDAHSSTHYVMIAHGKEYFFTEATESPLHPRWQKNCEQIDILVNQLAGIENVMDSDSPSIKKV
jgi:hypothetical protein